MSEGVARQRKVPLVHRAGLGSQRIRRVVLAIGGVALLGVVAATVWAEPAAAQSGSRIRGLRWRDPQTNETLLADLAYWAGDFYARRAVNAPEDAPKVTC